MDTNLAGIIQTWWEDDKVTQQLNAFRRVRSFYYLAESISCSNRMQALCSPLVERLGLEYSKDDSADTTQLRTLAVGGAAIAGDAASVTIQLEFCDLSLITLFAVLFKLCLVVSPSTSLVIPLPSR
jgi:hypothetical protein